MSALIQPPKDFFPGSTPAKAWEDWKEMYEIYEAACEFDKKPESTRKALFLHCLGKAGRDIYKTFTFVPPPENGPTLSDIFDKFTELYKPYKNPTQAAFVFSNLRQQPNMLVDDFIAAVKRQAQDCDFGALEDRMVSDRIIFGIENSALRERLLRESPLSLDKIVLACKSAEISKQHAQQIEQALSVTANSINTNHEICALNQTSYRNFNSQPDFQQQQRFNATSSYQQLSSRNKYLCSRCGTNHRPRNCPAYGKYCEQCGIFGHFARVCKKSQHQVLAEITEGDSKENNSAIDTLNAVFLDELTTTAETNNSESEWFATTNVNGTIVDFKLDTGAEVNALPLTIFSNLENATLQTIRPKDGVSTYSGEKLPVIGISYLKCSTAPNGRQHQFLFYIINLPVKPVLSAITCQKLGLVERKQQVAIQTLENDSRNLANNFHNLDQQTSQLQPKFYCPKKSIQGKKVTRIFYNSRSTKPIEQLVSQQNVDRRNRILPSAASSIKYMHYPSARFRN